MQLKKIKYDHYVVVTDDPIKEGDWYYHIIRKTIHNTSEKADYFVNNTKYNDFKKITHSTEPLELLSENGLSGMGFSKVRPLNIFEVKELIGEVNIEKKFQDIINSETPQSRDEMLLEATKHGFKYGYNQCLEEHTKVIHEILDHLCGKMELITQEMIDKGDFQLARYRTAKHC